MLFKMLKADELIQIGIHYAELNSNIKKMTTDDSQIVNGISFHVLWSTRVN